VQLQYRWVVTFIPELIYPWTNNLPSIHMGGPQSWSGHFGEQRSLLHLPAFRFQIIQPVAQSHLTVLSWLLYKTIC